MKKWLIETAKRDAESLHDMLTTQLKMSRGEYPPMSIMCSLVKIQLFINEVERVLKDNDLYEM